MNDTSSDYKSLRDAGFLHLLSCGDPTMASLVETIGPLDHGPPTPAELLAADEETLRACGLSRPKISYLCDLARHVLEDGLDLPRLRELPDDEVASRLVAVKGIGQWSADMFLIFHLGRADVLPVGDLGIRRAAERSYCLPAMPSPEELRAIAEPWRPHRTLACLYLWESLDTNNPSKGCPDD